MFVTVTEAIDVASSPECTTNSSSLIPDRHPEARQRLACSPLWSSSLRLWWLARKLLKHLSCRCQSSLRHLRTAPAAQRQHSRIDDLAAACRRAGLTARFDTLTAEKATMIADSVDIHGIDALVRAALERHRPRNPARSAAAWISTWQQLRPPRPKLPPTCNQCDEWGWLPDDDLGRAVRCPCRQAGLREPDRSADSSKQMSFGESPHMKSIPPTVKNAEYQAHYPRADNHRNILVRWSFQPQLDVSRVRPGLPTSLKPSRNEQESKQCNASGEHEKRIGTAENTVRRRGTQEKMSDIQSDEYPAAEDATRRQLHRIEPPRPIRADADVTTIGRDWRT